MPSWRKRSKNLAQREEASHQMIFDLGWNTYNIYIYVCCIILFSLSGPKSWSKINDGPWICGFVCFFCTFQKRKLKKMKFKGWQVTGVRFQQGYYPKVIGPWFDCSVGAGCGTLYDTSKFCGGLWGEEKRSFEKKVRGGFFGDECRMLQSCCIVDLFWQF